MHHGELKSSIFEEAIVGISKKFETTDKGDAHEYIGVKVQCNNDGSFKLSQPLLIDQVLTATDLYEQSKPKGTPALSSLDHEIVWNYQSIIGQLNFLEKSSESRDQLADILTKSKPEANSPG